MVSWIKIKAGSSDNNVLRVWCFKYQQASGPQNTQGFLDKNLQVLERDMFCNMESRNDGLTFTWK